ncbi:hypothetical protein LWM68_21395 [Niabella sp. W65]|nr:hypothetical protein [Niabella sp. W65]MCH7365086.1 hypothetical protein [Niabella sp. W65]ULT40899.1 hypothetical protein KRR40_40285 [Niabella sp. I65]
MNSDLAFRLQQPDPSLTAFVESFWELRNLSDSDKEIVVLPDGRADLTFSGQQPTRFVSYDQASKPFPSKPCLKARQ